MSHRSTSQDPYLAAMAETARKRTWIIRGAILAVVLLTVLLGGCMSRKLVTVDAGFEAVLIDKPIFIGDGGVQPETIKSGSKWIWRSTEVVMVDTRPFTIPKTIDDFASKDNYLLDFESAITAQVTDPALLVKRFGDDWFKSSLERPYLTAVREQVRGQTMSDLMANQSIVKEVDDRLTDAAVNAVKNAGLPIRIIDINLGKAKPAPEVITEMNATAAQTQRKLTLVQSEQAEIQREAEQKAKAKADNAYRNEMNLNTSEFVQLELSKRLVEACKVANECVLVPQGTNVVR